LNDPSPDFRPVLAAYPAERQPTRWQFLGHAGGFSGALLWRLRTPSGPLCLRRWPPGHPTVERLQFIQAVLWHVEQEGFSLVPVPRETRTRSGYAEHDGHLWELSPWMPGQADFHARHTPARLAAALEALARFHVAAASFPLAETRAAASPGILGRRQRLTELAGGAAAHIGAAISAGDWPELAERGRRLLTLFERAAAGVRPGLDAACGVPVALQPAIRDIWHDHVFFQGDQVSGLVDFGALRPETVAGDVARLLGSLAQDDFAAWQHGLAAYQQVRPLDDGELLLVAEFDRTNVLMSGIQWLAWVFVDGRTFENRASVLARVDENLARLSHLVGS
jgi:Ser/Thr protein kinase RdoA (MazF antagonist)